MGTSASLRQKIVIGVLLKLDKGRVTPSFYKEAITHEEYASKPFSEARKWLEHSAPNLRTGASPRTLHTHRVVHITPDSKRPIGVVGFDG